MTTNAYNSVQKTTMAAREAESFVLKKSAFLINKAIENPDNDQIFQEAWELTNDFWSLVQIDLMMDDNPLPTEVKANLYSLSIYVFKQLVKAAKDGDRLALRPISSINIHLAEGLMGNAG